MAVPADAARTDSMVHLRRIEKREKKWEKARDGEIDGGGSKEEEAHTSWGMRYADDDEIVWLYYENQAGWRGRWGCG